ncbi:MAG: hypothetical protein A2Y48_09050 [Nitrospirae bacterium RIFCSPLOW2_12_42_9]|nr:MAG: hypothetical protein A2Y48_09050 [Nitrospirae bacterium RIFCSPLOW2_12_42_9]
MTTISSHHLSRLSEFVASVMGLNFPEDRWSDLERGITSAAREFGFSDTMVFINHLISSPLTRDRVETLASYLTVGETYFFRDKETFNVLEGQILPELISLKGNEGKCLRIWSAGCSTGEEPYSIAILINRLIFDLKEWNITILATDINPCFIKKALTGVYTGWSFRDTPTWVKEGYFKKTKEGYYEILPKIKKMVTFSYLNLAEDVYPSLLNNTNGMDLIFSRNVLMYFSPDSTKKAVKGFFNSLVADGILMVSPAEVMTIRSAQFVPVNFPGVTLYRKNAVKKDINGIRKKVRDDNPPPSMGGGEGEGKIGEGEQKVFSDEINNVMASIYKEANLLYQEGRYSDAEDRLTWLLSHGPDNQMVCALLARTYANQGRLDEALKWCEKSLSSDILNPACHYLLATVLLEQGQIDEAIKSLKKVLFLDNNFILAYFVLGNIMLSRSRYRVSMKYFKNAVELLTTYMPEDVLPESDGITAGRLLEIIKLMSD